MELATTILVGNTYKKLQKLWGQREVNVELCDYIKHYITKGLVDTESYDGSTIQEFGFGDVDILAEMNNVHGSFSFDIRQITRYYDDIPYDVTTEPLDVETLELIINTFLEPVIHTWYKDPYKMEEEREHNIKVLNEFLSKDKDEK